MLTNTTFNVKYLAIILLSCFAIVSCEETTQKTTSTPIKESTPQKIYPKGMNAVFEAHGGIDQWNDMKSLVFTMEKETGDETHTAQLSSRKMHIKTPNFQIGSNGKQVWLAQDSTYYPPNRARFYHNLMFYFYAMPFVLGDDGIVYNEADPLTVGDQTYPGTKISFNSGVGDAPDDEYILYRNKESGQMEWLAYTVTYGKNEKSDRFSFIKYDQWQEVNGLILPKVLQWYTVEDGVPTHARNARVFKDVAITTNEAPTALFDKPEKGTFVD